MHNVSGRLRVGRLKLPSFDVTVAVVVTVVVVVVNVPMHIKLLLLHFCPATEFVCSNSKKLFATKKKCQDNITGSTSEIVTLIPRTTTTTTTTTL